MKSPPKSSLTFILLLIFSCSSAASASAHDHQHFLECLSEKYHNHSSISNIIYTPTHSFYSSVLLFATWNLKFASDSTPKPRVIITPEHESQIPPIVHCAQQNDLEIRTRSGGHDYEGLSYVSKVPFVVIDLIELSEITVDAEAKTAWVEAGALLGSLYYKISEKSLLLGFPGGLCPTVGVGGHISGGGYGPLLRKYGLAADHVIDARIVDAKGRILDRKSMGEDLFWAIRGGGGGSFGVITAWKLQLVDVPEKVTLFTVQRTLAENATQLVHRWQYVVPGIDKDLFLIVQVGKTNVLTGRTNPGLDGSSISATFYSLFLGGAERLHALLQEKFPELGVVRGDFTEMSWIQSFLYFNQIPLDQPQALLNRTQRKTFMKATSNYVQTPIPVDGLEGLWKFFAKPEANISDVVFLPYGGRMAEIPESSIPFPHRAGNLYNLNNIVYWPEEDAQDSERYISWSRKLYRYLTPYVLNSPRASYFNYRDLDIGVNNPKGKTSYARASVWGKKYFKSNFDRLVRVKSIVDPKNFFKNEQSIPPLHSRRTNERD
ncbi:hypothetical protein ACS0TY_018954 [Phlomoides rotata]